jgi:hypothetical protein
MTRLLHFPGGSLDVSAFPLTSRGTTLACPACIDASPEDYACHVCDDTGEVCAMFYDSDEPGGDCEANWSLTEYEDAGRLCRVHYRRERLARFRARARDWFR